MVFSGLSTPLTGPPAPGARPGRRSSTTRRERAAISRFCLDLVGDHLDSVHRVHPP